MSIGAFVQPYGICISRMTMYEDNIEGSNRGVVNDSDAIILIVVQVVNSIVLKDNISITYAASRF
jgi:hypothetical protein